MEKTSSEQVRDEKTDKRLTDAEARVLALEIRVDVIERVHD